MFSVRNRPPPAGWALVWKKAPSAPACTKKVGGGGGRGSTGAVKSAAARGVTTRAAAKAKAQRFDAVTMVPPQTVLVHGPGLSPSEQAAVRQYLKVIPALAIHGSSCTWVRIGMPRFRRSPETSVE